MPPLRPIAPEAWREEAWREQPGGDPAVAAPDRRSVLGLMAASFAFGLAGCDGAAPDGHYVPAVVAPPGIVSGVPNFYATATVADGTALGVVVEHAMGRPIKIEGNPAHPSSLGGTDASAQAAILDLYDPDRATGIQRGGRPSDRQALLAALQQQRRRLAETRGRGLRILTGPTSSPTVLASIRKLTSTYPEARWHVWQPTAPDAARAGAALAYGRDLATVPRLERAEILVSLGGDLLAGRPGAVRFARDFASRRNPVRGPMSRVYAIEPTPTLIGAAADHRFAAGPALLQRTVAGLAAGLLGGEAPSDAPPFLAPMLADLRAAHGRAFIDAGDDLAPEAHALVHAMNEALGGRGGTYELIEPPLAASAAMDPLRAELDAGAVEQLIVFDCNPVFTAPGFDAPMRRCGFTLASSVGYDETGNAATWYVPQTHPLETWGDALAHDGTATILQPQTMPLYAGWNPVELLGLLAGPTAPDPLEAVRATWQERLAGEDAWREALAAGLVAGTAHAPLGRGLRPAARAASLPAPPPGPVQVLFREDPYLGDGRRANNGWLQELPRPHTKLVWDNPLLLPPGRASALGVADGDLVRIQAGERSAALPAWIVPGQAEDVVIATLGNGRRQVGTVGAGAGFDTYPLRAMLAGAAPALSRAGGTYQLATTDRQRLDATDTTKILRRTTLQRFEADQSIAGPDNPAAQHLLYRREPNGESQWGMSVDLNACIGCNACVVACQAENNIPVVGKDQVLRQREMHWLRIDRYDIGDPGVVEPAFQPILCMHCEQAPCEAVCPVEATQHDQEGLNLMVYNRCVGTRFCSNNCPYKVRRFNFANYAHEELRPPIARNPDVSVRTRGVMEKCTFCVQRIVAGRIAHDRDGAPEQATTACQAACPTGAFTFGDLADPAAPVVARKRSPLDYPLLPEESTFPRVTFEARVRNRNEDAEA